MTEHCYMIKQGDEWLQLDKYTHGLCVSSDLNVNRYNHSIIILELQHDYTRQLVRDCKPRSMDCYLVRNTLLFAEVIIR